MAASLNFNYSSSSSSAAAPSSLPFPLPKSPPKYPDMSGKRRELAKIQILEREIGFLEEELKSFEGLQLASRSCKEVHDFVGARSDPLIPTNQKTSRSSRFWKRLCRKSCFNLSWICCFGWCTLNLKPWNCCSTCTCFCKSENWRCFQLPCCFCNCCTYCNCNCLKNTCCWRQCCTCKAPSCPDCPNCYRCTCSCPKCPKVCSCLCPCSNCTECCCNPCLFC